jgi:SAM-dependent methyltransferase
VANAGLKGNSEAHWDDMLARTWDDAGRSWPTKNAIIEQLTQSSQCIVDIACGNGSILRHLGKRGYTNLHGVEISRLACRKLSEAGVTMHRGRLPGIPLPDGLVDVVIASQVLEHIIRRRRFLTEIVRIMRPGGRAFIFVPDNCLGPIDEPEHVHVYDAHSLRRFISAFLQVIEIRTMRDVNHEIPILFAHCRKA